MPKDSSAPTNITTEQRRPRQRRRSASWRGWSAICKRRRSSAISLRPGPPRHEIYCAAPDLGMVIPVTLGPATAIAPPPSSCSTAGAATASSPKKNTRHSPNWPQRPQRWEIWPDSSTIYSDRPMRRRQRGRRTRSRLQWYLITVSVAIAGAAGAGFALTIGVSETEAAPVAPVAAHTPDLGAVQPVVVATPDILTAEGLTLFLQRYQEKFGDLQVDELTLFDEYARVSRAVPGQPNRVVTYDYRGGFQQSGAVTGRKAGTSAADLAELNLAALSDALAKAPGTLRVPNGAVTHMAVEVNDSGTYSYYGIAKDRPFVSIYAGNKFNESGHMILTPAGEVTRAWPFEG